MNSLLDPIVAHVLERLHAEAARDGDRRAARTAQDRDDDSLTRMGNLYLSVSPEEGRLLYLLARGSGAQSIVEFGASFGVSSVYLAAAARDNGGSLVTTEVHSGKCAATRDALAAAGLGGVASVIEGDARETLRDDAAPIDFLFLDGWKGLYLPLLRMLVPRLEAGAFVAADNVDHEAAQPYADYVRSSDQFVSHTLGKMQLSCYTP